MRIIEANQVPKGGISPNIWSLPCVVSAYKTIAGNVRYRVETPYGSVTVSPCDWICKYEDGHWDVMTNDQYKASVELKKMTEP